MDKLEIAVVEKKRLWIVSADGACSEQLVAPLTHQQRHARYRLAVAKAVTVLEQCGFRLNSDDYHLGFNMINKAGVMLDVTLKDRKRANIAHVTSYAGYTYQDEVAGHDMTGAEIKKVGAKVTYLSDYLGSRYFLQIGLVAASSTTPVYVELPDDCDDPERFCLKAIFATIADLAAQVTALQALAEDARKGLRLDPSDVTPASLPPPR